MPFFLSRNLIRHLTKSGIRIIFKASRNEGLGKIN
jgi:hypothetical protein